MQSQQAKKAMKNMPLVAVAQLAVQCMCRSELVYSVLFLVVDSDDGSGEPAVYPGLLVWPAWLLGPNHTPKKRIDFE